MRVATMTQVLASVESREELEGVMWAISASWLTTKPLARDDLKMIEQLRKKFHAPARVKPFPNEHPSGS